MDTPFPNKALTVDSKFLSELKDQKGLDVLSLLMAQRLGDLRAVKQWALAHIDKDIAYYQGVYEKEEDDVRRVAMELGLRTLKQLKINFQNESTVYTASMF